MLLYWRSNFNVWDITDFGSFDGQAIGKNNQSSPTTKGTWVRILSVVYSLLLFKFV